ncbi:hypothetical protein CVT24_008575 [Panaeolus cyanescens]|uniref:Cyclin N-terminal domain-containing protein n=1 Tax=Panaeolus cyanescens TaxID=181874 RepID=A0A409VKV8_9AGAR|nr:hypothetical protein CVT24_008575 [Panaeolus cyanescens]
MRPFTESFRYNRLPSTPGRDATADHDLYGSVCANYMIYLFASARYLYPSPRSVWQERLPTFIASVLGHSGLDLAVLIVAMTYLCKYKEANIFSVAYDDDAYRLFLASYMVAAQVSSDYDDELRQGALPPWIQAAAGEKFTDEELLGMQDSFRLSLKGDVRVDPDLYVLFQKIFKKSIRGTKSHSSPSGSTYLHPSMRSSPRSTVVVTPPPLYEETLARSKILCGSPISPARTATELAEEDRQILASLFLTSAAAYPTSRASRPSIKQKFATFLRRLDVRSSRRRKCNAI